MTGTQTAPIQKEATIRSTANTLRHEPSKTTLNQALTVYNSALRTTYKSDGKEATIDLIKRTANDVENAVTVAIRDRGFGLCPEDLLESFLDHSFNDDRDATTILTRALATEIIREVTDESRSRKLIPDHITRYMLEQTTSDNSECAIAAACIGWAIAQTNEPILPVALDSGHPPELSNHVAVRIVRHALHADQYTVSDRVYSHMNSERFSTAVESFEQDFEHGTIPVPVEIAPQSLPSHPDRPNQNLFTSASMQTLLSFSE